MQPRLVWMNGKLVPETEARISIYDSALMFGDMVFEMTRSFNKEQFKLREHLSRLLLSAKYVCIPVKETLEQLELFVYETIEANEPAFAVDDEHRLMINISRGALGMYKRVRDIHSGPNIIIADFPLRWTVAGMGCFYELGINLIITSQRAIPASLLESKVKNRSRLHYQMANIEVSKYPGDRNWALLQDPDGFITESTGANFFYVKNNMLVTPEPRNILRGISRQYIFELAKQLNLEYQEKNIEVYDVYEADEAFLTATPFCLIPVTSLNFSKIGDGQMGPVTSALLKAWSQNVGLDIKQQIQGWDKDYVEQEKDDSSVYSFK